MKWAVDRKVCLASQMLTFSDIIRLVKFWYTDSKVACLHLLGNILKDYIYILSFAKYFCTAIANVFNFFYMLAATVCS